jgi:hypothetical protein
MPASLAVVRLLFAPPTHFAGDSVHNSEHPREQHIRVPNRVALYIACIKVYDGASGNVVQKLCVPQLDELYNVVLLWGRS